MRTCWGQSMQFLRGLWPQPLLGQAPCGVCSTLPSPPPLRLPSWWCIAAESHSFNRVLPCSHGHQEDVWSCAAVLTAACRHPCMLPPCRAFEHAESTLVCAGDRPIEVTMRRSWQALTWRDKLMLTFGILSVLGGDAQVGSADSSPACLWQGPALTSVPVWMMGWIQMCCRYFCFRCIIYRAVL